MRNGLLALLVLGSCVVGALPNEGRRCTAESGCGPGTVCDLSKGVCVASTAPDAAPDSRPDVQVDDLSMPDEGGEDADEADLSIKPFLTCNEAELALQTPSTLTMWEPAVRADGLVIIARQQNTGWMQATRTTTGALFDAWAPTADYPACGTEECRDPSYFIHEDQEWMITAVGPKPRVLWLCDKGVCDPITVYDQGNPIAQDIDGPSIADQSPILLLLFNSWVAADTPQIAYLATPNDSSLKTWSASRLSTDGIDVDDPVISEDGRTIIFGNGIDSDLWVTGRDSVADPFGTPQHLASVSAAGAYDVEPDLVTWPSGELEIVFRSNRGTQDTARIYRAVCTR